MLYFPNYMMYSPDLEILMTCVKTLFRSSGVKPRPVGPATP